MTPHKIVHLVVDDKFIDAAIREFEAVAPGLPNVAGLAAIASGSSHAGVTSGKASGAVTASSAALGRARAGLRAGLWRGAGDSVCATGAANRVIWS